VKIQYKTPIKDYMFFKGEAVNTINKIEDEN